MALYSGSFSANGSTAGIVVNAGPELGGLVSLSIFGTFNGTVSLLRSLDGGANYAPVAIDPDGTPASWTSPTSVDLEISSVGMLFQLQMSGYSAGTANWQILSQPAPNPMRHT